jgi:hypothetical protein|nr:MAG TPA: hypothetical protein [Caudoviricetes sp.]
MKKYIPYAIAALVGFHLRWIVSALNGWSYSMNGMDIAVAITCIIMVWSFKGAFLGERRTSNVHPRAKRHSGRAVPQRKQPEDMR